MWCRRLSGKQTTTVFEARCTMSKQSGIPGLEWRLVEAEEDAAVNVYVCSQDEQTIR